MSPWRSLESAQRNCQLLTMCSIRSNRLTFKNARLTRNTRCKHAVRNRPFRTSSMSRRIIVVVTTGVSASVHGEHLDILPSMNCKQGNAIEESHTLSPRLWGIRCTASQTRAGSPVSTQLPSRSSTSPPKFSRPVLARLEVSVPMLARLGSIRNI